MSDLVPEPEFHCTSHRVRQIIPDFVESEYPQFVTFLEAYYAFLEQTDNVSITSKFVTQAGWVTVRAGNSTIVGANTNFLPVLAEQQRIQVGTETFRVRSIANNTSLVVFDIPIRTYFANTYAVETEKTTRQASGALRRVLPYHDVKTTLSDFIPYFRDTYLRDLPQGLASTEVLVSKALEFYQSRGSEEAFRFLFRALYNLEIELSYPREKVLTLSDGHWETPTTIRLDAATVTGNAALFEMREILGITSNARASVVRSLSSYEGSARVVTLFLDEVTLNVVTGDILLDDGMGDLAQAGALIARAYGIPPNGLATEIYEYNLILEDAVGGEFQPGEQITTLPAEDPVALTGIILGSVSGFIVVDGGRDYMLGDIVYPPAGFDGGYGARGRVSGFANTKIQGVSIIDGGEGYYAGLSLVVDNSGTGGGTGLAGYVQAVAPGHLILHDDMASSNTIRDGDVLTFTAYDVVRDLVPYQASRETIDYFEVGVSLSDLFGGLQIESDILADDGRDLWLAGPSGDSPEVGIEVLNVANTINGTLHQFTANSGSRLLTAALGNTVLLTTGLTVQVTDGTPNTAKVTITSIINSTAAWIATSPTTNVISGNAVLFQYASNVCTTLQETGPVHLNALMWAVNTGILVESTDSYDNGVRLVVELSGYNYTLVMEDAENKTSAYYGINAASRISSITSRLSVYPIYVDGVRSAIGSISVITLTSVGHDYLLSVPAVSVPEPLPPTTDSAGMLPLGPGYYTFVPATLITDRVQGSIGAITLVSSGAAYLKSNHTFTVNSSTSVVQGGGSEAELGLVLSAVTRGEGRFTSTHSMLSADRYFQSLEYYQPFAYVLTVEKDVTQYRDALRRFVHPAGGLLLVRQTVTTDVPLVMSVPEITVSVV